MLFFDHVRKQVTLPLKIQWFDNDTSKYTYLENKECVKYLGILIDSHLSWRYQIEHISTKISICKIAIFFSSTHVNKLKLVGVLPLLELWHLRLGPSLQNVIEQAFDFAKTCY